MTLSVVIPVHNGVRTLSKCLDAVYAAKSPAHEVIVVDDKSTDRSAEIARSYPCTVIELPSRKGAAHARNEGSARASGDIIVFIDADVAIKETTFRSILDRFETDRELTAVTGMVAQECPEAGFFSQYKNLYMHFVFKQSSSLVGFLFGSLIAVRKKDLLPFDETFRATDDTELGQRYKRLHRKILLDHGIEVVHHKGYSFIGLLVNDFRVPFWWARSFFMHNGCADIAAGKGFAHARTRQLGGVVSAYLVLVSAAALGGWPVVVSGAFFLAAYADLFSFLLRERGALFFLQAVLFTFLDAVVMGFGIIAGSVSHIGKVVVNIHNRKE